MPAGTVWREAMQNSDSVVSAWDGDRLVGLMSAVSDGVMHVYFHYLLERPEYQGRGIGKEIASRMLERCEHVVTKVPIAYNTGRILRATWFHGRKQLHTDVSDSPQHLTAAIIMNQ